MGKYDDYKPETSKRLEAGDYRLEVVAAEEAVSKKGSDMIVVTVKPNGSNIKIKHYFVKNEYFNRNMTEFFDSFNIAHGDFNILGWVGTIGAGKLKEDENGYLKVAYFISPTKAEALPVWQGTKPERQAVTGFIEIEEDGDLPF